MRVLAIIGTLVLLYWAGSMLLAGELTGVDMVVSILVGLLLSYLIHLWIVLAKDQSS